VLYIFGFGSKHTNVLTSAPVGLVLWKSEVAHDVGDDEGWRARYSGQAVNQRSAIRLAAAV